MTRWGQRAGGARQTPGRRKDDKQYHISACRPSCHRCYHKPAWKDCSSPST